MIDQWLFDVAPDAVVVTTTYVTERQMPILYVSHDVDEEGETTWQFHCGNGDFNASVLQLVRLDEILRLDSGLTQLARLPIGYCAKRRSVSTKWSIEKDISG